MPREGSHIGDFAKALLCSHVEAPPPPPVGHPGKVGARVAALIVAHFEQRKKGQLNYLQ